MAHIYDADAREYHEEAQGGESEDGAAGAGIWSSTMVSSCA